MKQPAKKSAARKRKRRRCVFCGDTKTVRFRDTTAPCPSCQAFKRYHFDAKFYRRELVKLYQELEREIPRDLEHELLELNIEAMPY